MFPRLAFIAAPGRLSAADAEEGMSEKAVRKSRVRLVTAIESYAASFGEALRINGVRQSKPDDDALYQREMAQWTRVSYHKEQVENALRAYTRSLRKGARKVSR